MSIHSALILVREDVGAIGKDDRNDHQRYMFRGVDAILNKVGPALAKHGVNCYPELLSLDSRDVVTSKGNKQREVTVTVAYHYVYGEGDEIITTVPGEAADTGDKAVSKAMSVALRTAHIQTLQIPTREADPDAHTMTRAVDPLVKVKGEIWEEARKRGWIKADEQGETFDALAEDFVAWSEGGDITVSDVKTLKDYLTHLRPKRTMKRGQS